MRKVYDQRKWETIKGKILDGMEVIDKGAEHYDEEGGIDVDFWNLTARWGKRAWNLSKSRLFWIKKQLIRTAAVPTPAWNIFTAQPKKALGWSFTNGMMTPTTGLRLTRKNFIYRRNAIFCVPENWHARYCAPTNFNDLFIYIFNAGYQLHSL